MDTNGFWADVKGYEGLYVVSRSGLVKGVKRNKVLAVQPNGTVCLCRRGIPKSVPVRQLVREAFRGVPAPTPAVFTTFVSFTTPEED